MFFSKTFRRIIYFFKTPVVIMDGIRCQLLSAWCFFRFSRTPRQLRRRRARSCSPHPSANKIVTFLHLISSPTNKTHKLYKTTYRSRLLSPFKNQICFPKNPVLLSSGMLHLQTPRIPTTRPAACTRRSPRWACWVSSP